MSVLNKLVDSCEFLEKISLCFLNLNSNIINSISLKNGRSLQVLDLYYAKGLNLESIQQIVSYCGELKEVNLSATMLSYDSISYFVRNITTKIEKLSLRFLFFLGDDPIKTLVSRCNKLTEIGMPNFWFNSLKLDGIHLRASCTFVFWGSGAPWWWH